jgi:predicted XRE-type DNA-binding protein
MTDKAYASVWDAIEDTPAQAENMKLRSALMMAISEHVKAAGLNQTQAANLFAVTQPRISDLMRGKINLFSLDMLVGMLSAAGIRIEMTVQRPIAKTAQARSLNLPRRASTRISRAADREAVTPKGKRHVVLPAAKAARRRRAA